MKKSSLGLRAVVAGVLITAATSLFAQPAITLPPNGDNQKSTVSQQIGIVKVTIDYNSPNVTSPTGENRTGKIWGELVPYGLTNLGFGPCKECPWRAGANENTVFTVSDDVKIQGQALKAGSYGLHYIVGPDEWTAIFSNNSTSWGSFFYDPAEDALRVKVKPEKNEFTEFLTFDFTDRQPEKAVVALKWESLEVPMTITVDNMADRYITNLRKELRSSPGFNWQGWLGAAQYALQNKTNLKEALSWAEAAVTNPFAGQENFQTLSTLGQLQEANGMAAESAKTMDRALNHPTASVFQLHQTGRQLITQKKNAEAMKVFELNARRYPNKWPVNVGLARGYAAMGDKQKALKHARLALKDAPDEPNRKNVEGLVKSLEEGKNIN